MAIGEGTRIGPYVLERAIGAGGMGRVFRARDTRLDRPVAIKLLPDELAGDPERRRRFEQEARATGALNHPNLVVVYDVGEHDGAPYLVTELLEGRTLSRVLADGPVPVARALELGAQLARGLAAAHDAGVVHRDLKPDNIFVVGDDHAKILDFGIAKRVEPAAAPAADVGLGATMPATATGALIGTPAYMAPEQLNGQPADHRTDLFALGLVLYELLAGRRPFAGDSLVELSYAVVKGEPAPLDPARVPQAVEAIVLRCLAKAPVQRFQSARDLAFALESAAAGLSAPRVATLDAGGARPATTTPAAPRRPRRGATALGGAGLLAAAAAAGWALRGGPVAPATGTVAGVAPSPAKAPPTLRRISFDVGLDVARFSPDGDRVYFSGGVDRSAIWHAYLDRPWQLEKLRDDAELMDVSPRRELLMREPGSDDVLRWDLDPNSVPARWSHDHPGLVKYAAMDPTGARAAVVVQRDGGYALEFPRGTPLHQVSAGWLAAPRVGPAGQVAFIERPALGELTGRIMIAEGGKAARRVTEDVIVDLTSLAWGPDGSIWFSSNGDDPGRHGIGRVATDGSGLTWLAVLPGFAYLDDVDARGRALVRIVDSRSTARVTHDGGTTWSTLPWLDNPTIIALTPDGKTTLLSQGNNTGRAAEGYLLAATSGGQGVPRSFGLGVTAALLRDGAHAVVLQRVPASADAAAPHDQDRARLVILHVDGSPPTEVSMGTAPPRLDPGSPVVLSADGTHALVRALPPDASGGRLFLVPLAPDPQGGAPRAFGVTGIPPVYGLALAPDGSFAVAPARDGRLSVLPVDADVARPIPGCLPGERLKPLAASATAVYVLPAGSFPAKIVRIDLATGKRTTVMTLERSDAESDPYELNVAMTADGRHLAYSTTSQRAAYWLVEGLAPATPSAPPPATTR